MTDVSVLAKCLWEAFVKADDGERLAKTGSLIDAETLKCKATREAFDIVMTAGDNVEQKRFWTQRRVSRALEHMIKKYNIEVPITPGFTWATWLKDQAKVVHDLSQKSRRNAWRRSSSSASSMDYTDTVPWDQELHGYEEPLSINLVSAHRTPSAVEGGIMPKTRLHTLYLLHII